MSAKEHPARLASQRSMRYSVRRSKEEWLSLFADDAIVEDPVGPSPLDKEGKGHRGKEAISTFFDRIIMTSGRKFEIKDSFACGQEVANVGTIHLFFPDGSEGWCDGVFLYKVNEEGKIVSLRAFWEWDRVLATIVKPASHVPPAA
ncbi:MAG: nuclear transport factor 2 family protein [Chloroflexi bacterium]|nr:nuclear transport factor 2 family protein [Chloroflexota bacterium]